MQSVVEYLIPMQVLKLNSIWSAYTIAINFGVPLHWVITLLPNNLWQNYHAGIKARLHIFHSASGVPMQIVLFYIQLLISSHKNLAV